MCLQSDKSQVMQQTSKRFHPPLKPLLELVLLQNSKYALPKRLLDHGAL